MSVYASETHSSASAPIQYGAVPAFSAHLDTPDAWLMRFSGGFMMFMSFPSLDVKILE